MSQEFEAARVVTTLAVEGGDQVKQALQANEQAADRSQKNLDDISRRKAEMLGIKPGQKYDAGEAMMADIQANAAKQRAAGLTRTNEIKVAAQSRMAADAGKMGATKEQLGALHQIQTKQISPMMAALGGTSAKSRMIEGMSGAGFQQNQDTKAKVIAEKEAAASAKEEAKQKALLNKETGNVTKGFGMLGKVVGGEGMAALRVAGLGGLATTGIVGGAAAEVAAARKFGGMANPGAAFRFDRAVADAQASLGRGLVPTLDYSTMKVRQFGDIVAGNTKEIQGFMSSTIRGWEFLSELTGFNAAAAKHKDASIGASVSPFLGQWSNAPGFYKDMASHLLTMTPPGGTGDAQEVNLEKERMAARAARHQLGRMSEAIQGERPVGEGFSPYSFGKPVGKNDAGQLIDAHGVPVSPFTIPAGSSGRVRAEMQAEGKSPAEINDATKRMLKIWGDTFDGAFKKHAPTGAELERTVIQ